MFNAAARMMESVQHGMLTIAKVRSAAGSSAGGRAMVAGQVRGGGNKRRAKQAKVEGQPKK